MSKSTRDSQNSFALALTVSDLLKFKIGDPQKECQGHIVQYSQ